MSFTSIKTNHKERLTAIIDFIGGEYRNKLTTFFTPLKINWIKQAGRIQSFTFENGEILVGDKRGSFLVNYDTNREQGRVESIEVEIINIGGKPNNYIITTHFPVLTINTPELSGAVITGISRQQVTTHSLSGNIEIDYIYDSGEMGLIESMAWNTVLENQARENSITTMYQSLENSILEASVNFKMSGLHNVAKDIGNIEQEKEIYETEPDLIGTWETIQVPPTPFPTPSPGGQTFIYTGGNSAQFLAGLRRANELNYNHLNMLTQKLMVTSTVTPTETYSVSANNEWVNLDAGVYQNHHNPTTFLVSFEAPQYITKIRIKGYPQNKLQRLLSVRVGNQEILPVRFGQTRPDFREMSREPIEIDCLRRFRDGNGIPLQNEAGQEYLYYLQSDRVQFTIENSFEPWIFLENIEIETLHPSRIDLALYNEYHWIRTQNESLIRNDLNVFRRDVFGPDNGQDLLPPRGRATWWNSRLQIIEQRKKSLREFIEDNSTSVAVLRNSSALQGLISNWRDLSDSSHTRLSGIRNSINNTSVEITKDLLTIESLENF